MPAGVRALLAVSMVAAMSGLVAGCGHVSSTDPGGATSRPCPAPGVPVELGALAFDASPDRFVALSGGRYRLTASGFRHDGPFDPKTGRTAVVWGPQGAAPTYDPGPATVSGTSGSAEVVEGAPLVVDLEEGTWWFLNSAFVSLTLQPCEGATARLADGP